MNRKNTRRSPASRDCHGPSNKRLRRQVLVTGYPGFVAQRLVQTLIRSEPRTRIVILVQEKFQEDAKRTIRACKPHSPDQVQTLVGDVAAMHLGLSAPELGQLTRDITDIYHLAAVSHISSPKEAMWRVNVQGTENLLEVAEQVRRLRRFTYVSTCFVSGDREGVIGEEELDEGQGFHNLFERTMFEAERKVRLAMERLPITIVRPSLVVGDSRTGEIGRFDGPYSLAILLVSSPLSVGLPLPGKLRAPLNLVPVDYVVRATYHLSLDAKAVQRTFHLVDPHPLSAQKVYEMIAKRSGKKPPRLRLSLRLTKTLLRLPGLEKISRAPLQAIDYLNTMAFFTSRNTMSVLDGSGITCPPFESYLDNLMTYVKTSLKAQKKQRDQIEDPLA